MVCKWTSQQLSKQSSGNTSTGKVQSCLSRCRYDAKIAEVLVIVAWKYPFICISSQFPLFLKNKIFVFYTMPVGLMTKDAVSGKEIAPSIHKIYSQSIQLTSSLTNLKGRRHFQQVPQVKMTFQYFWWCAICWKLSWHKGHLSIEV